jgi:hypothetical protein
LKQLLPIFHGGPEPLVRQRDEKGALINTGCFNGGSVTGSGMMQRLE